MLGLLRRTTQSLLGFTRAVISRVFCPKSAPDFPQRSATDGDSGERLTARAGARRWASLADETAAKKCVCLCSTHGGTLLQSDSGEEGRECSAQRDRTRSAEVIRPDLHPGGPPQKRERPVVAAVPSQRATKEKPPPGRTQNKEKPSKMLGPSGEFVELRVSGVRRLQRDLLPSRRRPAAPSDAPRRRPTVGSPRTPAPHTGTSCPSTSCGRD